MENIMKNMSVSLSLLAAATLVLTGCSAAEHRAELQDDGIDRVSVGTVQREIRAELWRRKFLLTKLKQLSSIQG